MAVVFFIAVRVFVGFPNDNGHRVLPHMKRNAQRPIPLSVQGVGTAASFLLHHLLRGSYILWKFLSHVKVFQWAAPLRHMHGRSALPLHG